MLARKVKPTKHGMKTPGWDLLLSLEQPEKNPNLPETAGLERGLLAKLAAKEIDELAEFLFVPAVKANEVFVRIQNDPLAFIVTDHSRLQALKLDRRKLDRRITQVDHPVDADLTENPAVFLESIYQHHELCLA